MFTATPGYSAAVDNTSQSLNFNVLFLSHFTITAVIFVVAVIIV
jgi:hypothetical protein